MNLFMLNYQLLLWRIDMADEMSETLQAMEADEPQANLYRAAEEFVSDQAYELMGIGDDDDFNKLAELMKQAVLYGAHWKEQQVLAKAIDAHIVLGPNNNHVLMNGRFNKYKWNDKVKIIIIKEDKV